MRRALMAILLGSLLGCGSNEVNDAVELCRKAIDSQTADQAGAADTRAMQQAASLGEDGVITIKAFIRFRAGTSDEGTQPFTCMVSTRNEKGEYSPGIIRLEIDPLGFRKTS